MVASAKGKDEDGLVVVGGRVEHANREEEEGEEEDDDYDRGMEAYERELNDEDTLSMHRGKADKSIKFKEEGVEEVIEDDDYAFASKTVLSCISLSTREVVNSSGVASHPISSPILQNFTNYHADK